MGKPHNLAEPRNCAKPIDNAKAMPPNSGVNMSSSRAVFWGEVLVDFVFTSLGEGVLGHLKNNSGNLGIDVVLFGW